MTLKTVTLKICDGLGGVMHLCVDVDLDDRAADPSIRHIRQAPIEGRQRITFGDDFAVEIVS